MNQPLILSMISPAYNEADNLLLLYQQLVEECEKIKMEWEWIIVDDHSSDATFMVASELSKKDKRVRAFRLSRNYGSHLAIRCGLGEAKGDCVIGIVADLQNPPSLIPTLLEKWQEGAHVVWAARSNRTDEKKSTLFFSRVYYQIMRDIVGFKDMPPEGSDFFLLDRRVVNAVNQFSESNVSLFALIMWMGFNQEVVTYDRQTRLHGKSGWSLEKKLKMTIDSVTSFSYKPIHAMTITGFVLSALAFSYLIVVIINYMFGASPEGWTSLMAAILLTGGLQIMMIGMLGEYIWRSLDESRRRPKYLIEATTDEMKTHHNGD